ncbi:hypothetical protein QOT17_001499 [Balamuthia mandrillaris]
MECFSLFGRSGDAASSGVGAAAAAATEDGSTGGGLVASSRPPPPIDMHKKTQRKEKQKQEKERSRPSLRASNQAEEEEDGKALLPSASLCEHELSNLTVSERFDFVSGVGDEVVLCIFSFLEARSLAKLRLVSQEWRRIAEDESLWKSKCLTGWPALQSLLLKCREETKTEWRLIFIRLYQRHHWSRTRKADTVNVSADGRKATVDSKRYPQSNVSLQTEEGINPAQAPFHYFRVKVLCKTRTNIGFGITDSMWPYQEKFVGFDKRLFNYGYTSNGVIRRGEPEHGWRNYDDGDILSFWVQYHQDSSLSVSIFLNEEPVYQWDRVLEAHTPPLYFTATLYERDTCITFC